MKNQTMKLFQNTLFFVCLALNSMCLQASESKNEENNVSNTALQDYKQLIIAELDLIHQAEMECIKCYPELQFKNGYVRIKYNSSIPYLYYLPMYPPCKKIVDEPRPLHSHEFAIPAIKNYKLHKPLLLSRLKAIENGTLQESDLTINHTPKLKTVTFDESSATDPNNPNITYRYDASSPYDQTFAPDNSACIVTAAKSPFIKDDRPYSITKNDSATLITSQERLDALKNDIFCYVDDQGIIIIGEKNHRESLSLEQQLKLAQEELDVSTLDLIAFNNLEVGSAVLYDNLLPSIFEQHYQQNQEITRLEYKLLQQKQLLQQQFNRKKYFAFQQQVNDQKRNEIQQEKARIKVQSNIQSIAKHDNNHCDCCTIS